MNLLGSVLEYADLTLFGTLLITNPLVPLSWYISSCVICEEHQMYYKVL